MRTLNFKIAAAMALLVAANISAVGAANTSCNSSDHRAFDFWLGEWNVKTPDEKLAGVNRIKREYNGCVIHERYTTGHSYSGESLNIYDASRKVWHQTWVDDSGTLLVLEGGIRDGKMVLEGESLGADGQRAKQRITWTPNANGSVRQLWESIDLQGHVTVAFDGVYTRK